jgi:hypothetical protein
MKITISMSELLARATSLSSGGDASGQPETGLRETERLRANRAKK